jgi:hypothetical protein
MTRIRNQSAVARIVLFSLLLASAGRAQSSGPVPGITFDDTVGNVGTVGNVTCGYEIDVTHAISISALGIFESGGNGTEESHTVALWNGSGTLLSSVLVPAGAAADIVNNFSYAPVTPLTLTPGFYVVGAYYQDSQEQGFTGEIENVTDLAVDPDFSIVEYKFAHPGFADPPLVITQNGNPGFENTFGPNFLMTEVPEPSTLALVGLGAAALIFRRRF